jgi:nitrate reductase gamma subunit
VKILLPLIAVWALVLLAEAGAPTESGRTLVAVVLPYAAFATFLVGFCWRVLRWAWSPVPFRIPTTCGQQKSLPWIETAPLDNPSSGWGVLGRMSLEIVLFRSLFRSNRARLQGERLILSEDKYLWLGALAFHWSLLVVLLRHLRLLIQPVPAFVNVLESVDGVFEVGTPRLYISDVVLLCALAYLTARRFRNPQVRYVSLSTDYFALFLLLGIAISGLLMRFLIRVDVVAIKQFALGLAVFHPLIPDTVSPIFLAHLLFVSALGAYFPFSPLVHMGGVFLSPTHNLANNNRRKRHVNPWNHPVAVHSYAEWEREFQDKLKAAGLPLEADDAGKASAN